MKKTFVELCLEWPDNPNGLTIDFAEWLDAQGYKPKKSRWIPFTATADSVCPVPPDTLVKVKARNEAVSDVYFKAGDGCWNDKMTPEYLITISYKVKKGDVE